MIKYLAVFFALLSLLTDGIGQTVRIDSVSKLKVCVGETFLVYYSSSGKFDSTGANVFRVQSSDSNGVFTDYPIVGAVVKATSGSIQAIFSKPGNHFRLVMFSTHPSTRSIDTSSEIQVFPIPDPKPIVKIPKTNLGGNALIGDLIQFEDASQEILGSNFLWSFSDDASIVLSSNQTPTLSYPTEGIKSGMLTIINPAGCSQTRSFNVRVLSCDPVIPYFSKDSLFHICTGTESGYALNVWVKSGGDYTTKWRQTVFVESDGIVHAGSGSNSLYYLKKGATFTYDNCNSAVIVLSSGETISFLNNKIDTFYCGNLQFDYSKVGGSNEVKVTENPLQITNLHNGLRVRNEGAAISAEVFDLVGINVFSKSEREMLSLDLSNLSNGVYFAIIRSGNQKELRKITVIH